MKKIYLSIAAALLCLTAQAEGYQVNTLSAKQLGMGHTSVALKLDSESVWFNPAAAAHQESKFDISAGVTGIIAKATFEQNDYTDVYRHENNKQLSTPLYVYMNYKPTENLAVGLSFNTPYGSSMDWGDNWAGAHLIQNISLTAYTAQPTISYKFLDGKLSVGAGLMLTWGNFELSKSMVPVSYLGDDKANLTLGGDAGLKVGYNVGIMYDISEKWSLGLSYRSKVIMEVDEGTSSVDATGNYVGLETLYGGKTVTAELPQPATLSAGFAYYPSEKWVLSGEFQWVGWSAYDVLDVTIDGNLTSNEKNYSNTVMVRVGAEMQTTEWLTARLGLYVDQSPASSYCLNPETPSMTKIGYTCGLSLMPTKNRNLSIDLAYGYVSSADPERMGSFYDETYGAFAGSYKATAHTFAVGLGFRL